MVTNAILSATADEDTSASMPGYQLHSLSWILVTLMVTRHCDSPPNALDTTHTVD